MWWVMKGNLIAGLLPLNVDAGRRKKWEKSPSKLCFLTLFLAKIVFWSLLKILKCGAIGGVSGKCITVPVKIGS